MSVYLQITNRCNFTCAHCCFACSSRGKDMSKDTFERGLAIAKEYDQLITLGGGEPTLHPLFKEFLMYSIWEMSDAAENYDMPAVHLVTNGSNTALSLKIANLAQKGIIGAAVSKDQYHDAIDPKVIKAFTKPKGDHYTDSHTDDRDCRSINDGLGYITPAGRAKKWGNHPHNKCACDSFFIVPNGDIYPCGCRKTKLGNVHDKDLRFPYEIFEGECEKSKNFKKEVLPHLTTARNAVE